MSAGLELDRAMALSLGGRCGADVKVKAATEAMTVALVAPIRVRLWVSPQDPARAISASELFSALRQIVREELRTESDRRSFAAASGLLTIDEAGEYLRISRSETSRLRHARKIAKSDAERDAAFAPEYGQGRNTKFKRAELDAWIERQKQ